MRVHISWSKPYVVISVTLALVLFATLCNTQMENVSSKSSLVSYLIAALIGIVLGNMACVTTKSTSPPRKCLFPWLAGGFSMSVTWTYIIVDWTPNSYVIPRDPSLYSTLLFLMGGVFWDLVILVRKNMKLDKFLGAGLLTIYVCFLFIRMVIAIGVIKF